jgi:DNA-binding NarL/FixJ family response regulator
MDKKIRVAILDDHISTVEGHIVFLKQDPQIEVVAKMRYGEELELMLQNTPVDVLLLDINVFESETNKNPYPILNLIPKFLQTYPNLSVLVISMHVERGIIRAVMESGANGYILKDDQATLLGLANVVKTVANGGIHFSPVAHELFIKSLSAENDKLLTPRQLETLSLFAAYPDATTADIANKMKIKNSTVRNLLSMSYVKLNVRNRTAAISKARELGIITPYPPEPPK